MKNLPEVINCTHQTEDKVTLTLLVASDLFWFKGHFPEFPILPGVAQIHWVMHFAQIYFPDLQFFLSMERIKFQNPIVPDNKVELTLIQDKKSRQLSFVFSVDQSIKSQGKIRFQ